MEHPGQIIGCNYSNAQIIRESVEVFLFVGGGRFHAIGLLLDSRKKVVVADPFENRAYILDTSFRKFAIKRYAEISRAKTCKIIGILIGLKPGQKQIEKALLAKKELEKERMKPIIIVSKEINIGMLSNFPFIEAYINTACPRIFLDESISYKKPILTFNESLVMVGRISWQHLLENGWFTEYTTFF